MTPNEITTVIATPFDKQFDMGYKLQLFERVKTWRARLIANTLERNPGDRIYFTQTFVVPLQTGDGYSISKTEVPRPMELGRMYYDYVGDGGPIAFVYAPSGLDVITEGQYTLTPSFDIVNNRIIVKRSGMCKVIIRGVLDNPSQELIDCQNCDYFNTDYPMTNKIAQQIITAVTNEISTSAASNKEGHLTVPATEGRV